MLSQYERRQLEQIEHQLTDEDPRLATMLARGRSTHNKWLLWTAGAIGCGFMGLGLVVGTAMLVIFGIAVIASVSVIGCRKLRD